MRRGRASGTQLLAPGAVDDVRIVEFDCSRRSPFQILDSPRMHGSIIDVGLRPCVAFRHSGGPLDSWICHVHTFPCRRSCDEQGWWTTPLFRRLIEGLRNGRHGETMVLDVRCHSLTVATPRTSGLTTEGLPQHEFRRPR